VAIPVSAFGPWGAAQGRYQWKLEANGYGTLILPWDVFISGDQEIGVALQPADVAGRTVLRPDGRPAAGAAIWFRPSGDYPILMMSPPYENRGEYLYKLETDASGRFNLPTLPEERPVVFTHPEGFLETSLADLAKNRPVQLQPWARVEGVWRVDGKPLAGGLVAIQSPAGGLGAEGHALMCSTATDASGNFSFTNLPPGGYTLSRVFRSLPRAAPTIESHRLHFELGAGEVKHLDYGFAGRRIAGHLAADASINWRSNILVLEAKSSPPPPYPFAGPEPARRDYFHSPQWLDYERQQQQFELVSDDKGNFQTDDVPPGTYELRLRSTNPEKSSPMSRIWAQLPGREDFLGTLVREVQVPAGSGPFDLGAIKMGVNPPPPRGASVTNESKARSASVTATNQSTFQLAVAPLRQIGTNGPTVKVTVLDEKTGDPVSGADVTTDAFIGIPGLSKYTPRWITDRAGFTEIPRGEPQGKNATRWLTITASHKGHAPHTAFWIDKPTDAPTNPPAEVTIRLSAGVTAGGTVRDEHGEPLAGIQITICGSDNPLRVRGPLFGAAILDRMREIEDGRDRQFASFWIAPGAVAALKTDAAGHWQINDFPLDLQSVDITLTRSDGTHKNFIQRGEVFQREGPGPGGLDDLKANRAELILEVGIDVRGIVFDDKGRPVSNAMVNLSPEGDGSRRTEGVMTDRSGRFLMRHCLSGLTTFSAESNNFSAGRTSIDVKTNMPDAVLKVGPRQLPIIGPLSGAP